MLKNDSTQACGVLFIDDEEKALKYFRMAYSPDFKVYTASSGREGVDILQKEWRNIGVVITDQRMPEMLGAEVLSLARQQFPNIVRILTTAYSDLESAIQAVNKGHIYQYVVKPWELEDLRMVLRRAADFHQILSERDGLLELKMTVLQRIICSDRLKWLLLAAHNWDAARRDAFRKGLLTMINGLPELLNPALTECQKFTPRHFQIGALVREEYRQAEKLLTELDGFWQDHPPASSIAGLPEPVVAELSTLEASAGVRVASALGRFLAGVQSDCALVPGGLKLGAREDGGIDLSLELNGPREVCVERLFGVLVEPGVPAVSVSFLEVLVALAEAGISLHLGITGSNDGGRSWETTFTTPDGGDVAEEAISALYEKFATWDISRM